MTPPPPSPDDLHYSSKKVTSETIADAVKEWTQRADEVLQFELAEEIQAGDYKGKPKLWKALVYLKTLDLLDAHKDMSDSISVDLISTIEDEALYHYAGAESAEEFFNAMGSQAGGSARYDLLNMARVSRWCESANVELLEPVDNAASAWTPVPINQWFLGKNQDGTVRHKRLRVALPELRRITGMAKTNYIEVLQAEVDRELDEEKVEEKDREEVGRARLHLKQKTLVEGILNQAANHTLSNEEYKETLNVRNSKPVIVIYKNGNDTWHVRSFDMTDHQKERFLDRNQFAAIIKVESSPNGETI